MICGVKSSKPIRGQSSHIKALSEVKKIDFGFRMV